MKANAAGSGTVGLKNSPSESFPPSPAACWDVALDGGWAQEGNQMKPDKGNKPPKYLLSCGSWQGHHRARGVPIQPDTMLPLAVCPESKRPPTTIYRGTPSGNEVTAPLILRFTESNAHEQPARDRPAGLPKECRISALSAADARGYESAAGFRPNEKEHPERCSLVSAVFPLRVETRGGTPALYDASSVPTRRTRRDLRRAAAFW